MFEARVAAEGPGGQRRRYRLHPPVVMAPGLEKKIMFGPWDMVLDSRPGSRGRSRHAVAAAQAAELVRGCEGVELAGVARDRARILNRGCNPGRVA